MQLLRSCHTPLVLLHLSNVPMETVTRAGSLRIGRLFPPLPHVVTTNLKQIDLFASLNSIVIVLSRHNSLFASMIPQLTVC